MGRQESCMTNWGACELLVFTEPLTHHVNPSLIQDRIQKWQMLLLWRSQAVKKRMQSNI